MCPQNTAYRGIDLVPSSALSEVDARAVASVSVGSLPAGVTLAGNTFSGTPTTAGTSTFTLTVQKEDVPAETMVCTMTVKTAPTPSRIQGADRYDQAAKVSASQFTTGSNLVYLASGEKFADALSAGSVAGVHGAPLLLTQAGTLPASTRAELTRLSPEDIVVVGGAASVSEAVVADVTASFGEATVTRVWGADRYAGSRALIADPSFGVPTAAEVYVAAGNTFPDALAASPAAIAVNGPVVLVDGTAPAATPAEIDLLADLRTTTIRIAGGPLTVSQGIQDSLGADLFSVTRASGADRYSGAVAVNQAFTTASTFYLASGEVFPDALSAAPVAGEQGAPVYLVQKNCVPKPVLQEIVRLEPTKIVILGGDATLSSQVDMLKPC